jgi:hypothetical protein
LVTCKQFLQELNDYLDPHVDATLKANLEAHVNKCPNCFVIVDTTLKTLQVYKGWRPRPFQRTSKPAYGRLSNLSWPNAGKVDDALTRTL